MFISMWISNTAATAMMIPIVETVLIELEAVSFKKFEKINRNGNKLQDVFFFQQGLGNMFYQETDSEENSEQ